MTYYPEHTPVERTQACIERMYEREERRVIPSGGRGVLDDGRSLVELLDEYFGRVTAPIVEEPTRYEFGQALLWEEAA